MAINVFYVRRISMTGCLCCLAAFIGCGQQHQPVSRPAADAVPYVTSKELSELVSNADLPVLVEFSVPAGCHRCAQMRSQLEELTTEAAGKVDVCRLDLNFERQLVAQLGITMCPTYVAFKQGEEVFRVAYPTSGEMLAAKLAEMTSTP